MRDNPAHVALAILFVAGASFAACASVVHVDGDNDSGVEDGSAENPFRLISAGVSAAASGDSVLVMPGVYDEQIGVDMHDPMGMNSAAVVMKDGVKLISGFGPDSTEIHGVGTEAAVYFGSCGAETGFTGFTVRTSGMGWGLRTSVLCSDSAPTISGNVLLPQWAGVYCWDASSPTIHDNTIVNGGVSFVSGSGGVVSTNSIEGGVFLGSTEAPCLPLRVESNVIFSSPGRPEGTGISITSGQPGLVEIIDNTLERKSIAVDLCYGELHGNRFLDNDTNLAIRANCDPSLDIDAEMNWWGSVSQEEITAGIVDCTDDPAILGCVDYEPWCIDPACTQSPVCPSSWGAVKAIYVPH